jgi:YD repeat-containing protein
MKSLFCFILSLIVITANAQYFYKDIIGVKETAELIKNYQANNVRRVLLTSYDANGTKSDDFFVEQVFSPVSRTLTTTTRSGVTDESILTAYVDEKGNVMKTVDSSGAVVSTTIYTYNSNGNISSILISSKSKTVKENEEHKWEYDQNGRIVRMLRIKNNTDTTVVQFKRDDNGNIMEEVSLRRGSKPEPVFYYYDSKNRLTDIVRFNNKARRLLPEYMFEYSDTDKVIQRITVPANSSEYLIWRYQYDTGGLKIREAVFNKQKQLAGKIEYQYQRG